MRAAGTHGQRAVIAIAPECRSRGTCPVPDSAGPTGKVAPSSGTSPDGAGGQGAIDGGVRSWRGRRSGSGSGEAFLSARSMTRPLPMLRPPSTSRCQAQTPPPCPPAPVPPARVIPRATITYCPSRSTDRVRVQTLPSAQSCPSDGTPAHLTPPSPMMTQGAGGDPGFDRVRPGVTPLSSLDQIDPRPRHASMPPHSDPHTSLWPRMVRSLAFRRFEAHPPTDQASKDYGDQVLQVAGNTGVLVSRSNCSRVSRFIASYAP